MASKEVLIALESLHKEIEKLEPAIKHIEAAELVTKTVKEIPQKHVDLLTEVKALDTTFKESLKRIFTEELNELTKENKVLFENTRKIQNEILSEIDILRGFVSEVKILHDQIVRINFPERLDKLDANVAGIISMVQAIQGRLDIVERNISDKIRDLKDYQRETRETLQSGLEQTKTVLQMTVDSATKKQQSLTYITWALILGVILFFFFTKSTS
jgi:hypothetical protein